MKKRLLFIPLHYNATPRPHEDWFNALNVEFDCHYYSSRMQVDGLKFDFIFLQSGAIDPATLRFINSGAKVIQWTGDARAEVMENVLQYKGIVDLTLLAVGIGQKEMYEKALGSPVGYLQQGVFESFFMEPKKLTEGKIVFIGNNYDQFPGAVERAELCEMLADNFIAFETIGNGFDGKKIRAGEERNDASIFYEKSKYNNHRSIPYEESAKIYNEAYISISHACFNDIEGYYSNRTLDIMAAGGCCLMRRTPNISEYIHPNDVLFYSTNDEAVEIIKRMIGNKMLRNQYAYYGHNAAKQKHTFADRAREIKQLIEQHL